MNGKESEGRNICEATQVSLSFSKALFAQTTCVMGYKEENPIASTFYFVSKTRNTTHVHILCIETILCNDEKYSLYGNIKSIGFLNRSICD